MSASLLVHVYDIRLQPLQDERQEGYHLPPVKRVAGKVLGRLSRSRCSAGKQTPSNSDVVSCGLWGGGRVPRGGGLLSMPSTREQHDSAGQVLQRGLASKIAICNGPITRLCPHAVTGVPCVTTVALPYHCCPALLHLPCHDKSLMPALPFLLA